MRKKVASLASWDDVNNSMKLIGELENQLDGIEIKLNRQLATAKENAENQARPIHDKIKLLEKDIKAFVTIHSDELDGKTKKLNFGKTGFRQSSKVVIPKTIPKEDFIAILKKQGLTDCIQTEEKVLREVLKTHTKDEVHATGAYLQTKDEFWYEVEKEKLVSSD